MIFTDTRTLLERDTRESQFYSEQILLIKFNYFIRPLHGFSDHSYIQSLVIVNSIISVLEFY